MILLKQKYGKDKCTGSEGGYGVPCKVEKPLCVKLPAVNIACERAPMTQTSSEEVGVYQSQVHTAELLYDSMTCWLPYLCHVLCPQ